MIAYSIHIVDDDDILREGLPTALEEAYEVKAFATAETALNAMRQHPPDLVLLDIGLPAWTELKPLAE